MRLAYGFLVLCHSFRVLVSGLHQPHRVSWETSLLPRTLEQNMVIALILLDPRLPMIYMELCPWHPLPKAPPHCLLSLAVSFIILVFFQFLASSATGLLHMPPLPSDGTVFHPLACWLSLVPLVSPSSQTPLTAPCAFLPTLITLAILPLFMWFYWYN